jgi:hypothetical protein
MQLRKFFGRFGVVEDQFVAKLGQDCRIVAAPATISIRTFMAVQEQTGFIKFAICIH